MRRLSSAAPAGITTLELVVAIAIGSVIFLIVGGIFLTQAQFFSVENALAETQANAFQAIDAAGQSIVPARQVVSGRTINGTDYVTSDALVVLELPAVDASGNVIVNGWDFVAVGQDPLDATRFIVDIDAAVGSTRPDGKQVKANIVDKVIFRYNTVSTDAATAIELYVRMRKDARGRAVKTSLGKIYYLGSS